MKKIVRKMLAVDIAKVIIYQKIVRMFMKMTGLITNVSTVIEVERSSLITLHAGINAPLT